MRAMTIPLSPQQPACIQQAVETGDYVSDSEVLRDALSLWEQRWEWSFSGKATNENNPFVGA